MDCQTYQLRVIYVPANRHGGKGHSMLRGKQLGAWEQQTQTGSRDFRHDTPKCSMDKF